MPQQCFLLVELVCVVCRKNQPSREPTKKKSHENDRRRLTLEMNDVNMIMCMNYDVKEKLLSSQGDLKLSVLNRIKMLNYQNFTLS